VVVVSEIPTPSANHRPHLYSAAIPASSPRPRHHIGVQIKGCSGFERLASRSVRGKWRKVSLVALPRLASSRSYPPGPRHQVHPSPCPLQQPSTNQSPQLPTSICQYLSSLQPVARRGRLHYLLR